MKKKNRYIAEEGIKYDSTENIQGDIVCCLQKEDNIWHFIFKGKSEIFDKDAMCAEIKVAFKCMGVWAMYGRKNKFEKWECLQVAQKSNRNLRRESIGCEIATNLDIMFLPIPEECDRCKEVQNEDRAFYQDVYERYKCEKCNKKIKEREAFYERFNIKRSCKREELIINISRRFDIYHQIARQYDELIILCIDKSEWEPQNKKEAKSVLNSNKKIECEYAERHQAIYFHDIKYASR